MTQRWSYVRHRWLPDPGGHLAILQCVYASAVRPHRLHRLQTSLQFYTATATGQRPGLVPAFASPELFAVLAAATRGRQASRHRRGLRDPTSARGEPRRPQGLRHRLTAHTRALQPRTQISDNLRHARSAGCNRDKLWPHSIATAAHRKPALCGRPLRRNRQ